MAKLLLKLAATIDPARFRSHPRRPKIKKKGLCIEARRLHHTSPRLAS
jgi:hypothetical protein